MNRKLRRQQAAVQKRIRQGSAQPDATAVARQLGQVAESLQGLEGLDQLTQKLEPMIEQVDELAEDLGNTQQALRHALEQNQALNQEMQDQKTTFLWLIAEVTDKPLDGVEQRYALAIKTLQEQRT